MVRTTVSELNLGHLACELHVRYRAPHSVLPTNALCLSQGIKRQFEHNHFVILPKRIFGLSDNAVCNE